MIQIPQQSTWLLYWKYAQDVNAQILDSLPLELTWHEQPFHFWAPWARYFTQHAGGHCKTPVGCDESQLPPTSGGCFSQKWVLRSFHSRLVVYTILSLDLGRSILWRFFQVVFEFCMQIFLLTMWKKRYLWFDTIQMHNTNDLLIYCIFAYLRSLLYMSGALRPWLYLQGTKHRKWFIMLLFPSYQHPPDRTTAARGSGRSDLRGFTHHAFLKSKVLFRKLLGM